MSWRRPRRPRRRPSWSIASTRTTGSARCFPTLYHRRIADARTREAISPPRGRSRTAPARWPRGCAPKRSRTPGATPHAQTERESADKERLEILGTRGRGPQSKPATSLSRHNRPNCKSSGPFGLAISPPTDIVMDVLKAAEPASVAAARARLAQLGGPAATDVLFSAPEPSRSPAPPPRPRSRPARRRPTASSRRWCCPDFVQSMLPNDSDDVYGGGLSGDMWKGCLPSSWAR